MNFDIFFYISEKYIQLRKKKMPLLRQIFGSPYTSDLIYLQWNCFSSYLYLKDMYIILKGTGKILFILVLRIFANL